MYSLIILLLQSQKQYLTSEQIQKHAIVMAAQEHVSYNYLIIIGVCYQVCKFTYNIAGTKRTGATSGT